MKLFDNFLVMTEIEANLNFAIISRMVENCGCNQNVCKAERNVEKGYLTKKLISSKSTLHAYTSFFFDFV